VYNVSGFYLAPIKYDRHHISEKLLSMVKNLKQSIYLSNIGSGAMEE
jgi:hypothetical protein